MTQLAASEPLSSLLTVHPRSWPASRARTLASRPALKRRVSIPGLAAWSTVSPRAALSSSQSASSSLKMQHSCYTYLKRITPPPLLPGELYVGYCLIIHASSDCLQMLGLMETSPESHFRPFFVDVLVHHLALSSDFLNLHEGAERP